MCRVSAEVGNKVPQGLWCLATFLSALLLFGLQPMIARAILPWFGGGAGVWNCAQFFFQGALLLGYLYAHLSITRTLRQTSLGKTSAALRQGLTHGGLIICSLACLPVLPSPRWISGVGQDPAEGVLFTLVATVGLPYLVLSATSPLVASWYVRVYPERSPYPLFAWSNFGSLLGLLGYPLVLEPALGVRNQAYVWSFSYLVCTSILGFLAYRQSQACEVTTGAHDKAVEAPGADCWFLWIAMPVCMSGLLVSITQHISMEIATVPLLWVIPLSLYLLSYIIVASSWNLFRRWLWYPLFVGSLYWVPRLLDGGPLGPVFAVVGLWACLGILFTVCHGELWQTRPQRAFLSHFYLSMSVGGALGSFLVAYVAPRIFDSNTELPIFLFVCPWLVLWSALRGRLRRWPTLPSVLALALALFAIYQYGTQLLATERKYHFGQLVFVRNFYGSAKVDEVYAAANNTEHCRILVNGRTTHGSQYLRRDRQKFPTSYFGTQSGVGRIFTWLRQNQSHLHVGIVGLGVGTLATYGRSGDEFVFYELDPKIEHLALSYFKYVPACLAQKQIVLGDARLSLEKESPGKFDLLVIDAFTGDSIPVHLLTEEAFQVYRKVLKPDGILAVHVTNQYLDLPPVVAVQAAKVGMLASQFASPGGPDPLIDSSLWVAAMSPQHPALAALVEQGFETPVFPNSSRYSWSDDKNNLLSVFKLGRR